MLRYSLGDDLGVEARHEREVLHVAVVEAEVVEEADTALSPELCHQTHLPPPHVVPTHHQDIAARLRLFYLRNNIQNST